MSLLGTLGRFIRDEAGPTAVEYAIMMLLIVVACMAVISSIGSTSSRSFNNVYTTLSS